MRARPCLFVVVVVVAAGACVEPPKPPPDEEAFALPLPTLFPAPRVPEDNPITPEKIELGRHLFFDTRLSLNGTQSCASCHEPARAFTDGRALPTGSTGDVVPRNSMMLANAAWWSSYTWANPNLTTLEEQALVPLLAEHPVELGIANNVDDVIARLADDAAAAARFAAAFPDDEDPVTLVNITRALATFERSLISGRSRYDRYVDGELDLTDDEKRGLVLFNSETTECYHCHGGPFFTSAFVSASNGFAEPSFQNTGLYNLDAGGAYPEGNVGLFEFTGDASDMGRFRVPTLRNLGFSAPYFHDGSAASLEDVVAHYEAGGRTIVDGEHAGVGKDNPHKNPLVRPFTLTEVERRSLVAFLRALDDDEFAADPRHRDPAAGAERSE